VPTEFEESSSGLPYVENADYVAVGGKSCEKVSIVWRIRQTQERWCWGEGLGGGFRWRGRSRGGC
jgi:hypothetical protein